LDKARWRLDIIFRSFDNVYVSFSGGKDSGVLLNLCLDYIRQRGHSGRFGVFHIDYEAQYQQTTDYVERTFRSLPPGVDKYHICLPIAAQCATSMFQRYWIPWEESKREMWVRTPPKWAITDQRCLSFFREGMWDYELQDAFAPWLHRHNRARRTCCLIGIRTQESLNRWRTIHHNSNIERWFRHPWTNVQEPGVVKAYPIYDWQVEDVWTANARFGWDYNKLYDLFYLAGLTVHQMRVASPFNDYAKSSLYLYRTIDPRNWGRMVGRVNGVNFTGIYGSTTAMGWRSIKLPSGQTWESYYRFLLSTLPEETRKNYEDRFAVSVKFWREHGGCLATETIAALRAQGVEVDDSGKSSRSKKRPVKMQYLDDVDLDEFRQIPTYKRMCICILKNDHMCKYMGFAPTRVDLERREAALNHYKEIVQ
jgi:predicted phosphoadenosine phosphosulfate sulfurtransferase